MRELRVRRESWPIRGSFTISRGSRTTAEVVVAEVAEADALGRGECVPYVRYGESPDAVVDAIEGLRGDIENGLGRQELQTRLAAGAARNALDAALWDLEAKHTGKRVWELAGMPTPQPVATAYTLSLDAPTRMAVAAKANSQRPLLKLKLAGPEDLDRVAAVRANAPRARLIVDANEGWSAAQYKALAPQLKDLGVEMIEQPLPAGDDGALVELERTVPVCADESCHDTATLGALAGKYDMVNIKLDKTGGLSEALQLKSQAQTQGFAIMVGCMLATSLAMAPALLVAQEAEVVDLDGPLLLAEDRQPGLRFEGSFVYPPDAELWG